MTPTAPGAISYPRVSQDNERSVPEQNADNQRAADRLGVPILAVYAERKAISASRFTKKARPEWERLVADVVAGTWAGHMVILWEVSRGDRKLTSWSAFLDACRTHRMPIHITSQDTTYNLAKGRDWQTLAEEGIGAAMESEKTSVRVLRSTAAAANEGRPHGRVPYGYERVYDPTTRVLVEQRPHPVQAPIVRRMVADIGAGTSLLHIAADLNARGVAAPASSSWSMQTVRAIAMRPTNIGKRSHNGVTLDGNWPALVDELDHWTAVRTLSDPVRRTTRPGRQKWLLSMLVRCDGCAGPLTVQHPSGRNGIPVPVYACRTRHCVQAKLADLDRTVLTMLLEQLTRPALAATLTAGADDETAAAQTEVARLRAELDGYLDAVGTPDGLSPANLKRVETRLAGLIADAEKRIVLAPVPGPLRLVLAGDPTREEIRTRLEGMEVPALRELIRAALPPIVLTRRAPGSSTKTFDPSRIRLGQPTTGK